MPHTISKTVFYFDELDESAKERARDWYRQGNQQDYEWWDSTYDYCKEFLAYLGFDFKPKAAKIYFSGFSSQGDGACFDNVSWSAKDCDIAKAREYFGEVKDPDSETREALRLINETESLAKDYPELSGYIKHRGHYNHEFCTDITVDVDESGWEEGENGDSITPKVYEDSDYEEEFAEFARDCMKWVYRCLEREDEYLNSGEVVDESIQANEYEFNEDGSRAC